MQICSLIKVNNRISNLKLLGISNDLSHLILKYLIIL